MYDNELLKFNFFLDTMANQELFYQWLRTFFFLNQELHQDYNAIYQNAFYVHFYELVTVGLDYANEVAEILKESTSFGKKETFNEIVKVLTELKSDFSDSEFEFIEYKRHSASHIFQHHYEISFLENGKLRTKRKNQNLIDIKIKFQNILTKYGLDRGFDDYMDNKLYTKVNDLYLKLKEIKEQSENQ